MFDLFMNVVFAVRIAGVKLEFVDRATPTRRVTAEGRILGIIRAGFFARNLHEGSSAASSRSDAKNHPKSLDLAASYQLRGSSDFSLDPESDSAGFGWQQSTDRQFLAPSTTERRSQPGRNTKSIEGVSLANLNLDEPGSTRADCTTVARWARALHLRLKT
jgi:hypothetical protein